MEQAFLATCRVLMGFCCINDGAPAMKKQASLPNKPPPRYVCYHDVDEDLIQKQLEVCTNNGSVQTKRTARMCKACVPA